jgi:hypothetical protein
MIEHVDSSDRENAVSATGLTAGRRDIVAESRRHRNALP